MPIRDKVYDKLKSIGLTDSKEDFFNYYDNDENVRKQAYNKLREAGLTDSEEDFYKYMTPQKTAAQQIREQSTGEPYTHEYDENMNLVGGTAYKAPDPYQYKPEVQDYILQNKPDMFKPKESLMDAPLGVDAPDKTQARAEVAIKNQEDMNLQKARTSADLRGLSASVDSELDTIEQQINDRRNAVRNENWKPGIPSARDDKELARLRGQRTYLDGAKELIEESQKIVNAAEAEKDGTFVGGVLRGVRDTAFDVDTWTMGISDLVGGLRMKNVLEKSDKGESLTSAEQALLDAAVNNMVVNAYYQSDLGRGYKAGQVTGESLPFMLEMMVNPVSASGNAIAKQLLNYGLKKFAKNKAAQVGARVIGDAAAAAGMTATTGMPAVLGEAVERTNRDYNYTIDENGKLTAYKEGNTSFGEALGRSAATRFLENQSEMIFRAFDGVGSLMGRVERVLPGGVNRFMDAVKSSRVGQLYKEIKNSPLRKEIADAAKIGGIGEEYLEEVYNNFANVAIGEMTMEEALDLDRNIDTFLGLAPTQVMFSMIGLGGMGTQRYKNRREMERAFGTMSDIQKQKLQELQEMGKLSTNKDIRIFIKETMADQSLTPEQRRAEIEYAYDLAKQNAVNEVAEAEVQDNVESENQQIDAVTDPRTGNYTEVDRWVVDPETGVRVPQSGNIVGWIGEAPVFVPEGMENTEENRIVLKPNEWNPDTIQRRPAEEVKTLNEEMIREEAAVQAEQESKYAPEVLNAQMQQGVPFETEDAIYLPMNPMLEGNGWVVEVQPKGVNNKVAARPFIEELTNDQFHDMLQAQLDTQEAAQAQAEEAASNSQAIVDGMQSKPMNDGTGRIMQPKGVQGDKVVYDITDAEGNTLETDASMDAAKFNGVDEAATEAEIEELPPAPENITANADGTITEKQPQAPVIPTKEDGSVDFVAYGKEGSFKTLGEKYGEKMPNKVAVTAKALADDLKKARQKLDKAIEAYDNAPIGREQKAEQARDKAQQELDAIKREADFWAEMDAEIKSAQMRRNEILNPQAEVESSSEPMTADEFVAQQLAVGNIVLNKEEYKKETGFGDEEANAMNGGAKKLFAEDGMTIQEAGERLMEMDRENGTNFFDQSDSNAGRDALISVLGSVKSRKELNQYISENRKAQAQKDAEGLRDVNEKTVTDAHFASLEDFVLQMEAAEVDIPFEGMDIAVKDAIFAEAEEEYQSYLKSLENGQGTTNEAAEGSDNVLSEEQPDNSGRTEERQGQRDGVGQRTLQEGGSAHTGEQAEEIELKQQEGETTLQFAERAAEENRRRPLRQRANEWSKALGVKVNFLESIEEVDAMTRAQIEAEHAKGSGVPGWVAPNGEVYFFMPDLRNMKDIDETYVHEVVAHIGMEKLLGKERFAELCDKVWDMMPQSEKDYYEKKYPGVKEIKDETLRHRRAADEYIAHLAEKQNLTPEEKTIWDNIVKLFRDMLDKALNGIIGKSKISDADISNLIKASYANLKSGVEGNVSGEGARFNISEGVKPSLLDVVRTLYTKGKAYASQIFQRSFFDVANTPQFMKDLGLRGDKFTVKYGVIARHFGKDGSHDLTEEDWSKLPESLQNPFAISKIKNEDDAYRIYTALKTSLGEYVVVGVDVKNAGRYIEVNAISTVFGRRSNANLPQNEEVIYRSPKITPEQTSLLEQPNSVQYPSIQENISTDKDNTSESEKQGNKTLFRVVYHGSGADFDKFDHSKMGSGAGSQVFGWGTYVTESRDIAKNYGDVALKGGDKFKYVGNQEVSEYTLMDAEQIMDRAGSYKEMMKRYGSATLAPDTALEKAVTFLKSTKEEDWQGKRHFYEVEIPDEKRGNYIVNGNNVTDAAANKVFDGIFKRISTIEGYDNPTAQKELKRELDSFRSNYGQGKPGIWKDLYGDISYYLGTDKEASLFLNSLGYVGIKYPAGTIYQSDYGNASNYVIFDENDLTIVGHTRFRRTNKEAEELRDSDESKALFDYAKKRFGRTFDLREAGYILPDGAMLDFSGRHEMKPGSDTSFLKGQRSVDHRYVADLNYEPEDEGGEKTAFSTDMADFINRGAIRIDGNVGSINLTMIPTKDQKAILQRMIQRMDGDVWVDFSDGWNTEHSAEYAAVRPFKILSDIDKYYNEGIKPEGNVRFRFIGERGARNLDKAEEATTRLDNLSVAREMETSQKDAKAIKMATGWERGADGKWRYEVKDYFDADAIERITRGAYGKTFGAKVPLERVLKNDDTLLTEYPQLKDISVRFQRLGNSWGVYYPKSNEIAINTNFISEEKEISDRLERQKELVEQWRKPEESKKVMDMIKVLELNPEEVLKDAEEKLVGIEGELEFFKNQMRERLETTIIHEVQHAIQHIEGFENGGSIDSAKKEAAVLIKEIGLPSNTTLGMLKQGFDEGYATNEQVEKAKKMAESRGFKDVKSYIDSLGSERFYNRMSGEVEARNAARRSNSMSKDDMREYLASETEDVAREDQVFLQNAMEEGQTMFRISDKGRKIQSEVEKFTSKYNSKEVVIVDSEMTDGELEEAIPYSSAERTRKEISKGFMGGYSHVSDKIYTFVDNHSVEGTENTMFHENLHSLFDDSELVNDFYERAKDEEKEVMDIIRELYNESEYPNELFANVVAWDLTKGNFKHIEKYLTDNQQDEFFNKVKEIGYDKEQESATRRASEELERNGGRRNQNNQVPDSKMERGVQEEKSAREQAERLGKLFGQVADMGLDGVLGNGHYDKAMMDIYRELPEDARRIVSDDALGRPKVDFIGAMSDYLNNAEISIWDKVTGIIRDALRKVGFDVELNTNDVKYILWRSRKPLDRNNLVEVAEDIDMRYRLKVGEYSGSPTRFRAIDRVNEKFNEELSALNEENADKVELNLGSPSAILRAAGVEDKPMKLYGNKVIKKMKKHGFNLDELRDLPNAVADPIAVFENYGEVGNRSILTELKTEQGNFLVTLSLGKGHDIDFNIVTSVFGKGESNIVDWIEKGYGVYYNKKKTLDYLHHSALKAVTSDNQGIDSATKIVESFENPKIEGENVRFRAKKKAELIDIADERPAIIKEYDKELKTSGFNFQEAFQDRMLSVKVLMEKIEAASGKKARKFEDAYEAENQLSSKNKVEQERWIDQFYRPLLEELQKLSDKYGFETVRRYVYCKSGLERNEVLRQRDADAAYNEAKEELDDKLAKGDITQAQYDVLLDKAEDQRNKTLSEDVDYSGLRGMLFNVRADELFKQYKEGNITEQEYNQKIEDLKNDKANVIKDWKDFAEVSVSDLESRAPSSEIDALWSKVNAATNETLRIDFESGMIDRETYEAEKKMMKYYVPLRNWANTTAEDMYEYRHDMTPAVTSNQKTAKGRESEADNPIATIALMVQNAIVRGNRNKMKMAFYSFVVNRPTALASVRNVWYVRDANNQWQPQYADTSAASSEAEMKQIIEQFEDNMKQLEEQGDAFRGKQKIGMNFRASGKQRDEHVVAVMINGKEYAVYVNGNPRAAQAVNGLTNNEAVDDAAKWIDALKRYYGAGLTSWNPDFIIPNLVRDTIHATTMTFLDKGVMASVKYAANVPRMFNHVAKEVSGISTGDPKLHQYFEEFVANGGETGYTAIHTLEDYKKEYDKLMNEAKGLKGTIGKNTKEVIRKISKVLEAANRIAEDVNRFNAYVTSRESGAGVVESVSAAKNITVNFNRKGALNANHTVYGKVASWMSRWILFFNPSVQGIYQLVTKTKENPKRATALGASILASGFIVPMINDILVSMFGDDEDDYWNQSDYKRRNNWMLFVGDGYISIPLPPVLRELYGIGDIMYGVITGHIPAQRAVYDMLKQVQSAVGFVNVIPEVSQEPDMITYVKGFAPDIVAPFMDVISNSNFMGRPIAKWTDYNESDPEYERVYKGVGKHWVELSKFMNELGGNETRRSANWGNFINPVMMEHLFTSYTGGIGKTINNLAGMIIDAANGDTENMDVFRKTPVLHRFYTPNDEKTVVPGINRKFYEFNYQYNNAKRSLKKNEDGVKSGEHPEWQKYIDEMKENGEYEFIQYFERENKKLKKIQNLLKGNPTNKKELEQKEIDKKAEIATESLKILRGEK